MTGIVFQDNYNFPLVGMRLNTYWVLPHKKYCFGQKCLDYITDIKLKINLEIKENKATLFICEWSHCTPAPEH